MTQVSIDQLKRWYQTHRELILKDFVTFLSFPSISADPQYHERCRETARWLCDYMNAFGLSTEIWDTSGLPVVFGSYRTQTPNRPTLLIYHHYDVQPVDPLELWKSDPFQPTIRDQEIYARGASDNKGQCFYTLTALKAFFQLAQQIDLNIKVMIEGEEECASKGTAEVLQKKRSELKADYLLVVDSDMIDAKTPAITLGIRGITALEVQCSNSSIDLHSGIHGGIALNPNRALVQILHSLWDEKGSVAIAHFYDAVESLSKEQKAHLDLTFDEESYQKSFGVKAFCNEKGRSIRESNGLRPTLEINGMWGGYTGKGFKTVIPAKAFAKLSCRLVPSQDPVVIARLVEQHLQAHAPQGIEVSVHVLEGAPAYRSPVDSAIVKTVATAYGEVFGVECHYVLSGGSIPIVPELERASQAEVAMIGVALPSDDIHAPNEHFALDRFELGFVSMGRVLDLLSQGGK